MGECTYISYGPERGVSEVPLKFGLGSVETHLSRDVYRHVSTSNITLFKLCRVKRCKGAQDARLRVEIILTFLREIDASVPAEMPIHLIMDNDATHKTDKVRVWLAARPRYNIHFTPISASWLNLVQRFFSTLSEKWINRQAMDRPAAPC